MTQRLRKAQPALVVIAIGCASDQTGLISLLSAGLVDRLMLKPVTPSLAQIVLKSAVQQHRTLQGADTAVTAARAAALRSTEPAVVLVELQRHAAANDLTEVRLDRQPSPAEVVVPASTIMPATADLRSASTFLARPGSPSSRRCWHRGPDVLDAAARNPAIDPQAVIANNLVAAQRALNEGHALEPRGRSALDHYNTVLALDPTNAAARQGIDQIADRFAAQAESPSPEGRSPRQSSRSTASAVCSPSIANCGSCRRDSTPRRRTYAAKVSEPIELATQRPHPESGAGRAPSTTRRSRKSRPKLAPWPKRQQR